MHLVTDKQGRSQISYTALCNGFVSHKAQIGGRLFFTDHARRNKRKTNASMIFACGSAFYACFIFMPTQ